MFKNGMPPIHPGEVLREDYMKPLGLSSTALAKLLRVPASRVNDIVLERRGITADTALRLSLCFGGGEAEAKSWINMQATYDLKMAQKSRGKIIAGQVHAYAAAQAGAAMG